MYHFHLSNGKVFSLELSETELNKIRIDWIKCEAHKNGEIEIGNYIIHGKDLILIGKEK